MSSPDIRPSRIRTAIALSVVLHVFALLLLATLLTGEPSSDMPETNVESIASVTTIVRRDPPLVHHRFAAPAPRPTVAPLRVSRVPPARGSPVAPLPNARSSPVLVSLATFRPALRVALLLPRLTPAPATPMPPTPQATAAPTPAPPTPQATAAPTRTPAQPPGPTFGGLFSQNYPPAFATAADVAAIRSRLRQHVHIRVDVDETGRATDVRFDAPAPQETLAAEIRTELLALRYVPADCNGLHCEGTLQIDY